MALRSQGVVLKVGDGETVEGFNPVAELSQVTGVGSGTAAEIPVTNLGSERVEVIMGLPDEGSATVGGFLDPGDTVGQMRMKALRDTMLAGNFQLELTDEDDSVLEFPAFVTQFSFDVNVDGAIPFTSTLRITGAIEWTSTP